MAIFENVTLVWFIAGIVFLVLEALTPGFFLIFFGLGACVVAGLNFFVPLPSFIQWIIFMAVSVGSLMALRKRLKVIFEGRLAKNDNIDDPVFSSQYIGREVLVLKDIAPGQPGLVELNGTNWQAASTENSFASGERVKVKAIDGLTLVLEK